MPPLILSAEISIGSLIRMEVELDSSTKNDTGIYYTQPSKRLSWTKGRDCHDIGGLYSAPTDMCGIQGILAAVGSIDTSYLLDCTSA
jgi:hypothetical protein